MTTTRSAHPGALVMLALAWGLSGCNPQFSDPPQPDFAPCPDGKPCSRKCPEAGPCADASPCEAGLCPDQKPCPDATAPDATLPDKGVPPSYPLAFGGVLKDVGRSIGVDSKGNVFVAGSFYVSATFGTLTATSAGASDGFLAKVDPSGKVLWVLRVGNTYTNGLGVTVDAVAGQAYIYGSFSSTMSIGSKVVTSKGSSDVFVARVDGSGKVLWAASAGGAKGEVLYATSLDATGNLYLLGHMSGTALFGTKALTTKYGWENFVARISSKGDWAAAPLFTFGEAKVRLRTMAVDSSGKIHVAGDFAKPTVTLTWGTLTLTKNSRVLTKDKAGKPTSWAEDVFWLKLTSKGTIQGKVVTSGGTDRESVNRMVVDKSDSVYMAGRFMGQSKFTNPPKANPASVTSSKARGHWDVMVVKRLTNDTFQWIRSAGSNYEDHVWGLTLAPTKGVLIVGSFKHKATFDTGKLPALVASKEPTLKFGSIDVFAAELDDLGTFTKAHGAGGHGKDYGSGIAATPKGTLFVTGWFTHKAIFGKTTLSSHGDDDAFVWKIP